MSGYCCGDTGQVGADCFVPRVVKVVILGNVSVGKTTLINKIHNSDEELTSMSALSLTSAYVNTIIGGIECNIWDTAGQERYRSIAPVYLRASNICIIVYSLKDDRSYNDIHVWEELIDRYSPGAKRILVATMSDLAAYKNRGDDFPVPDAIVSAVQGDGIEDLKNLIGRVAGEVSGQHVI